MIEKIRLYYFNTFQEIDTISGTSLETKIAVTKVCYSKYFFGNKIWCLEHIFFRTLMFCMKVQSGNSFLSQ